MRRTITLTLAAALLASACAGGKSYSAYHYPPSTGAAYAPAEPAAMMEDERSYSYAKEEAYGPSYDDYDLSGGGQMLAAGGKDKKAAAGATDAVAPGQPATPTEGEQGNAAELGQVKELFPAPDKVVKGRIVIYEAKVTVATFQVKEKTEALRKAIKDWGGYMISMGAGVIVFRVPVEKFEEVVDKMGDYGEVVGKDIWSDDVTDQFNDLQIKLANAIAVRKKFEQLLAKAVTVEEGLKVEKELERITGEIELLKGKLKLLRESALFSKVTVYLQDKAQYQKPIPPLPRPLQWIQYELGINNLFEL